jgi:hypothetical protein
MSDPDLTPHEILRRNQLNYFIVCRRLRELAGELNDAGIDGLQIAGAMLVVGSGVLVEQLGPETTAECLRQLVPDERDR